MKTNFSYLLLRISPDEYSALDFLLGDVLNNELAWASLIMLTVTTGGDMWTFNLVPTKSLTVAEKRVLVFKTWGGCFSAIKDKSKQHQEKQNEKYQNHINKIKDRDINDKTLKMMILNMTAKWLPDYCLTTAWRVPYHCLPDNCLKKTVLTLQYSKGQ